MPWSLLIDFVAGLLSRWLAAKRAEQALRDLGAATARNEGLREAERQEAAVRAGDEAASAGEDDPRDLRSDP